MSRPSLCDGLNGTYGMALHSSAIVVVLGTSILGTCMPIITKYIPFLQRNPFFFVVAKTAATGVLLSVSTIHLINDAVINFNEPCVNEDFRLFYRGYAFVFALIAALAMHVIDLQLAVVTTRWASKREEKGRSDDPNKEKLTAEGAKDEARQEGDVGEIENQPGGDVEDNNPQATEALNDCSRPEEVNSKNSDTVKPNKQPSAYSDPNQEAFSVPAFGAGLCPCEGSSGSPGTTVDTPWTLNNGGNTAAQAFTETMQEESTANTTAYHQHQCYHGDEMHSAAHGHSHAIVLPPDEMPQIRRVIAAICMEFGVTLHSVFVGLDIGLTTDRVLKPLLIALVFHQLFEGISLGSRLVDAKFKTVLEVVLAMVFSFSAPIGMVAATIAVSIKKDSMSGGGFVLMMAVLSSFCGGILLYLAFNLLFTDFPDELARFATPDHPYRRVAMFVALWVGMLAMAIVGKWL